MAPVNHEKLLARIEAATAACEQATLGCREATREAREALADLRRERREVHQEIKNTFESVFDAAVKQQLGELGVHIRQAIDQATQKVYARFDKISAILLGVTDPGPSLMEYAERAVEVAKLKQALAGEDPPL